MHKVYGDSRRYGIHKADFGIEQRRSDKPAHHPKKSKIKSCILPSRPVG